MTDELAKVLHDAARDSLLAELVNDTGFGVTTGEPIEVEQARGGAEFCLSFLRFGERMARAVEMASILHDLTTGQTIAIPKVDGLLARWQECKP